MNEQNEPATFRETWGRRFSSELRSAVEQLRERLSRRSSSERRPAGERSLDKLVHHLLRCWPVARVLLFALIPSLAFGWIETRLPTKGADPGASRVIIFAPEPGPVEEPSPYWLTALYLMNRLPSVGLEVVSTAGSLDSLLQLESKPRSLAIVQSDVLYHYRHGNHPQFPTARNKSNARLLTPLFDEEFRIRDLSRECSVGIDRSERVLESGAVIAGKPGSGTLVTAVNVGRTLNAHWLDDIRGSSAGVSSRRAELQLEVRARPSANPEDYLYLSTASACILQNAYPNVYRAHAIDAGMPAGPDSHARAAAPAAVAVAATLVAHQHLPADVVQELDALTCFGVACFDSDSSQRCSNVGPTTCEGGTDGLLERLRIAWRTLPAERRKFCVEAQKPDDLRDCAQDLRTFEPPPPPAVRKPYQPIIARHRKLLANEAGVLEGLVYEQYDESSDRRRVLRVLGIVVVLATAVLLVLWAGSWCWRMTQARLAKWEGPEGDWADSVAKIGVRWAVFFLPLLLLIPAAIAWWAYPLRGALLPSGSELYSPGWWNWVLRTCWQLRLGLGLLVVIGPFALVAVAMAALVHLFPGSVPPQAWRRVHWYLPLRIRHSAVSQKLIWFPSLFVVFGVAWTGCIVWGAEFFADTLQAETDLVSQGALRAASRVLATILGNPPPELRSEWSRAILTVCRYAAVIALGVISLYAIRVLVRYLNRGPRVLIISMDAKESDASLGSKPPTELYARVIHETIERRYLFEAREGLAHPGAEHKVEQTHRCRTIQEGLFFFDFQNTRLIWDQTNDDRVDDLLARVVGPDARKAHAAPLVCHGSTLQRHGWTEREEAAREQRTNALLLWGGVLALQLGVVTWLSLWAGAMGDDETPKRPLASVCDTLVPNQPP